MGQIIFFFTLFVYFIYLVGYLIHGSVPSVKNKNKCRDQSVCSNFLSNTLLSPERLCKGAEKGVVNDS